MPTTFIQVGNHWINLDLVTGIELVPDPKDQTQTNYVCARVWYTNGKSQEFMDAADVKILSTWLKAHKAPKARNFRGVRSCRRVTRPAGLRRDRRRGFTHGRGGAMTGAWPAILALRGAVPALWPRRPA
jgi:hypothetical protein